MTRALVIYHSLFGNTRSVAESLARGIRKSDVETDCLCINEVDINRIRGYDFLAIGGPTHMMGLSKAMKIFLESIKTVNLQEMRGFSFDTRNPSRLNKKWFLMLENSAARRIEGIMKRMNMKIIKSCQSAIVENGREGPLREGSERMFEQFGVDISKSIRTR